MILDVGMFISRDPIGLMGGNNVFKYAPNPTGWIDPLGLDAMLITFPEYKAAGIPFTGHAAVITIDENSGATRYYEYGRYDPQDKGWVMRRPIPDLTMKNSRPSAESLKKLFAHISKEHGKNSYVAVEYHSMADDITAMHKYADDLKAKNNDETREPYGEIYNNCFSFAAATINKGYNQWIRPIREGGASIDPRPDWPMGRSGDDMKYFPKSDTLIIFP